MLVQRHIEVDLMWVPGIIPRCIAEGKSLGSSKCRWIHEQRTKAVRTVERARRDCTARIPYQVWTRSPCSKSVSDTCVVRGDRDRPRRVDSAPLRNGKGSPGRKRRDPGVLPPSQKLLCESAGFEKRQVVDIACGNNMALVEIGTGPIRRKVVSIV